MANLEIREEIAKHYPQPAEVDAWIESIWEKAAKDPCRVEVLEENGFTHSLGVQYAFFEFRYVKFTPADGDTFYGYWQPAWSQPAPLLVHVPGYGAEISMHPDLVMQGYNVLHISPLGYATPHGPRTEKMKNGNWPVLADTVATKGEGGYKDWLTHCVQAIQWAQQQPSVLPGRISFFGTSQGGGGALLLGSIYQNRGTRCVAADVPFLTNFPLGWGKGAYELVSAGFREIDNPADGYRSLGFVDTMNHARRMTFPVLLTGAELDDVTPRDTIESLFAILPHTRSYTMLHRTGHRYTREFMHLATAWFRMYA